MTDRGQAGSVRWWGLGDLNAFFGLMLDNVTNLVLLSGILVGVFDFPADIILTRMIPGTALGVLIGDLVYTWMAVRLARRTGRSDVTAMPLGLDTPSTIGIAVAVLGPTFQASGDAVLTWHVGMATLIFMGVVKVVFSFLGEWVQKSFPQAGLLGSIGGVGLALLGFLPLVHIFDEPVVGLVSLGIIIYTLVGRVPGACAAVAVGALIYHGRGLSGLVEGYGGVEAAFELALPLPTLGWVEHVPLAVKYLPIAVPFGLLTIVGGINVSESARVAGDEYRTRDILLTEAAATLVAGFCGGVAQSTPYIGHPAYKAMGGRAAYTLATGLFIGIGSIFGLIPLIVAVLPVAAVAPILVFVGLEIITQSYHACPREHAPAVTMAFLPALGSLVLIYFDQFAGEFSAAAAGAVFPPRIAALHETMRVLGHGFILTAMLWGGITAHLVDRQVRRAGLLLLLCAAFSLFGVIHSVMPHGELYLPWRLDTQLPFTIAASYFLLGMFAIVRKKPYMITVEGRTPGEP
jgi:AGZA family xanthine/uracil permease-like MFS transporter